MADINNFLALIAVVGTYRSWRTLWNDRGARRYHPAGCGGPHADRRVCRRGRFFLHRLRICRRSDLCPCRSFRRLALCTVLSEMESTAVCSRSRDQPLCQRDYGGHAESYLAHRRNVRFCGGVFKFYCTRSVEDPGDRGLVL